jgi:hypothetical protein
LLKPGVIWSVNRKDKLMQQLHCRDLKAGDILLKVSDGSILSRAIQFGQHTVGGVNSGVVHAGVMFDSTFIIEAQGAGISANDLRVQNAHYGYHVFRCRNGSVAAGAGTCARMMFDIHQRGRNLGYSAGGAIGSLFGGAGRAASGSQMDALLDRILQGRHHRFFCSQFVVFVYQFVAEQCQLPAATLFSGNDAKVEPSELAAKLQRSPQFTEIGYLMPDQR